MSTKPVIAVGVALSLALVPVAVAQPAPGVDPSGKYILALSRGESQLRSHQSRLALQTFRSILELRPDHHMAQLGALRAMADGGLCDGASDMYDALEGTAVDNAKARAALGECLEVDGAFEGALELYAQAVSLDPYEPTYGFARANLLARMGREAEAEAERIALFGTERGLGYAFVAEAIAALRRGDPSYDAVMEQVGSFRFHEPVHRLASKLESARAMREDCVENPAVTFGLSMVDPELGAVSAECVRRSGDAEGAWERLSGPHFRRQLGRSEMAPVVARLYVDQGELHAAERALASQPDSLAPVLASRWYLARARGDARGMEVWAARYQAHPEHRLEPLEALVPRGEAAEP